METIAKSGAIGEQKIATKLVKIEAAKLSDDITIIDNFDTLEMNIVGKNPAEELRSSFRDWFTDGDFEPGRAIPRFPGTQDYPETPFDCTREPLALAPGFTQEIRASINDLLTQIGARSRGYRFLPGLP
jgi:hypothetical protein